MDSAEPAAKRGGGPQAHAQEADGNAETHYLPDAVIESLSQSLCGSDMLTARAVCRRWRELLTPQLRVAVLTPRHCPPAPAPRERSRWLAKALPGLQTLQLVVDANRTPRATPPYLLQQMVEPFLGSSALRSFALTFRTCVLPNEGYDEQYFDAYVDRWCQTAKNVTDGLQAVLPLLGPKLTSLELNAQCNLLGQLHATSQLTRLTSLRYTLSDHYTLSHDDCRVLGTLTSLNSLYLRAWLPRPFSEEIKGALGQLTGLTALELEAVSIPPDDTVMEDLTLVAGLKELQVLRIKGLGLQALDGLAGLTKLRDLTLTLSDNMGPAGWQDMAALRAMTSLNINAWANYAPTEESSTVQRVQTLEGLLLAAVAAGGVVGPATPAALPAPGPGTGAGAGPGPGSLALLQAQPGGSGAGGSGSAQGRAGNGVEREGGAGGAGSSSEGGLQAGPKPGQPGGLPGPGGSEGGSLRAPASSGGGGGGGLAPSTSQGVGGSPGAGEAAAAAAAAGASTSSAAPASSGLAITHLKSLGIKLQAVRDIPIISRLTGLEQLILAFDPSPPSTSSAHAAAAGGVQGAAAGVGAVAGAAAAAAAGGVGGLGLAGLGAAGVGLPGLANLGNLGIGSGVPVDVLAAAGAPTAASSSADSAAHASSSAAAIAAAAALLLPLPLTNAACVASLGALTGLRRLDVYDTSGHMKLTQQLLEDFSSWFPLLGDLYFEGAITVTAIGRARSGFKRLVHMDLINVSPQPFTAHVGQLPPGLAFFGVQSAVLVHPGPHDPDAAGARALADNLQSLSFMKGVTWVDMRQQACLAWAASCAVLSSVRLEWTLSAWEEEVRGKPTTPLAALAAAPRLQYVDVMFVDSCDASEGLLDSRLAADLAGISRLEELEVWTRSVADWHEDMSWLPLARCARLRSLKLEVLPALACLVVRELLAEALPACKLRLVAHHVGPPLQ